MQKEVSILCKLVVLLTLTFSSFTCAQWNPEAIEIERFSYLDGHYSAVATDDSLLIEAYLIHGYHEKFKTNIEEITDRYVCDSILPDAGFPRVRFITFFRETKNTNRENFQVKRKSKNIYARTNDKVLAYRIKKNGSVIDKIAKKYYPPVYGTEVSFRYFHCGEATPQ